MHRLNSSELSLEEFKGTSVANAMGGTKLMYSGIQEQLSNQDGVDKKSGKSERFWESSIKGVLFGTKYLKWTDLWWR